MSLHTVKNPDEAAHEYQYTTIEYTHPDPELRSRRRVSVMLQMDYGEVVAGVGIGVA